MSVYLLFRRELSLFDLSDYGQHIIYNAGAYNLFMYIYLDISLFDLSIKDGQTNKQTTK